MNTVPFFDCCQDQKKLEAMREHRIFSDDALEIRNMLEQYASYTDPAEKMAIKFEKAASVFHGETPDFWDRYKTHVHEFALRWALDLEKAHEGICIRRGIIHTKLHQGALVDALVIDKATGASAVLKYVTKDDSVPVMHKQCEYEMGFLGLKKAFIVGFDDAGNVDPKWTEIQATVATAKRHEQIELWARAHFGQHHNPAAKRLTAQCIESFERLRRTPVRQ